MLAIDLCDINRMMSCVECIGCIKINHFDDPVKKGAMLTTLNSSGERLHTTGNSSGEQEDSLGEKGSPRLTAGSMHSQGSSVSVDSSASSAADGSPANRKARVWTVFLVFWWSISLCHEQFFWYSCLVHFGHKCWNLLKILRRSHDRIPSKLLKPFNSFEFDYTKVGGRRC